MKAKTAATIQKHPYSPKLDNDRTDASNIQQTDGMLIPICQLDKFQQNMTSLDCSTDTQYTCV